MIIPITKIVSKLIAFLKSIDYYIFIPIVILMIFGLLTMSTLGSNDVIFSRQVILIIIALSCFLIFSTLDYRALKNSKILLTMYGILLFALILIFIFGHISKGGNRWFNLGSFFIGPSEPMKLILILILAKFFAKRHIAIANLKNIVYSLIYVSIPAILIMLQPDLSTAIVLVMIWFGMLIVSGLTRKHFLWFIGVALSLGLILWSFYFKPYQKSRIVNFINPTHDLKGTGWNAYQSIIAVGSGGLTGKGVGYGTQSRFGYLPEHETDFIFASFLEEWGIIGGIVVFILYGIIIFSLTKKAVRGETNFETLTILGVIIWLVTQTTFNIGMNIGVFPVTGIPLPLMSHGGSHLLTECIALGMCVGMSRYGRVAHQSRYKQEFIGLE